MQRLNITVPDRCAGRRRPRSNRQTAFADAGCCRRGHAWPASITTCARADTLRFWTEWLERGAQFTRAGEGGERSFPRQPVACPAAAPPPRWSGRSAIDLPYSNFAYDQTGTPWPVNQAVYVDYMLFGLRGYSDVATEELRTQYRNNQETNGHVGGYANWLVYTPGMLYATGAELLPLRRPRRVRA